MAALFIQRKWTGKAGGESIYNTEEAGGKWRSDYNFVRGRATKKTTNERGKRGRQNMVQRKKKHEIKKEQERKQQEITESDAQSCAPRRNKVRRSRAPQRLPLPLPLASPAAPSYPCNGGNVVVPAAPDG